MAKKIGICVNLDCDNYKKDIEVEPGAEFECPLCHQHLKEKVKGPGPEGGNKFKLIAVILAVLVIGGGTAGYFMMGNDKEAPIEENIQVPEEPVVVEENEVTPEVEEPKEAEPVKPVNGKGTVDLGYATYNGDLKNGKPHGYGILTYKKSHKIVSSKDFTAKPGDTFEGEFRDGKISGLGYWKHDGNQTVVKP